MGELKQYLKGGALYMIHRLDQPVEGLVVFAKDKESAAALSKAVSLDGMNKIYLAECYGNALTGSGELTDYVKKAVKGNVSAIVSKNDPAAKEARLEYEVLDKQEQTALLRIKLGTGRHHQIRLQLSNAGMSILGDRKYAREEAKLYSDEHKIKDIRLCACRLEFTHPATKEKTEFKILPAWCFTYKEVSDRL